MDATLEMNQTTPITVDELADFMNYGWPGADWFLEPESDLRWEQTFTQGTGKELYRTIEPGVVVDLQDFAATVRWQGYGPDPTRGRGRPLRDLVRRWQQERLEPVLIVQVPREKLDEVSGYLQTAGCLFKHSIARRETGGTTAKN